MTFGEKLQSLRQRAGMSQDALAERLQVSRQAVSRWERNETMPETDKVVALADIFGVTTDYLLRLQPEQTEPEEKQPPPQERKDWVERFLAFSKRKWYLLGWVLIAWGVLDLVQLALFYLAYRGMLGGLLLDALALMALIALLVGIIWFLAALWKCAGLYDGLPPKDAGLENL